MRRLILAVAVVAFVTSSAAALPTLVEVPTLEAGHSVGNAITPDGKYVGGQGPTMGFVWDAGNGTRQPWGGSYLGKVTGIGYRTPAAAPQELVIHASDGGWHGMPASTDVNHMLWSKRRRTYFPTSAAAPSFGPYNTLGGNTTSDRAYAALWHDAGGGTHRLYIDTMYSNPWAWEIDSKDAPTEAQVRGCSSTGLAVGYRKDGSGVKTAYAGQDLENPPNAAASTPSFGWVPGLAAGQQCELYDAADNAIRGTTGRVGGFSRVADARTGMFPFIHDFATTVSSELPAILPGEDKATNGVVYGVAPDGQYAVGMDYSLGMELAVLWNLTDANPANWTALDLTQFAIDNGILGNFTGNLRRGTAMGYNAQGQPVITGRGITYNPTEYHAFVLTVPEPATLAFLALGGLALLRRRR